MKTKALVLVPIALIFLAFVACLMAMQNAKSFGLKIDSFLQNAAEATEEKTAIRNAEAVYALYHGYYQPLPQAEPLLNGGNQTQEVTDSKGLIKVTSRGDVDGCHYTVEFPKLGIPSLRHDHYLTPLEQPGGHHTSDCDYQGMISLGRAIIKHLRGYFSWMGKSYNVQRYVFALLVEALEEILGDNAISWGVEIFELLKNFK